MQRVETSSWRLEIDGDQSAHLILFVRDACDISPIGLDVPPPLIGGVAKHDLGLNPLETAELTKAWSTWWRKFLHNEGDIVLGESYRALSREVFDPPRFESLANYRPLQEVAQRLWPLGEPWRLYSPYIHQPLTENVAKCVLETQGVGADKLRANVKVLLVEGMWSSIPEPGLLLCSARLFDNREFYALELQKAFESRLG